MIKTLPDASEQELEPAGVFLMFSFFYQKLPVCSLSTLCWLNMESDVCPAAKKFICQKSFIQIKD